MRFISLVTSNYISFAKGSVFPSHTLTLAIKKPHTFVSVGKQIENLIPLLNTAIALTTGKMCDRVPLAIHFEAFPYLFSNDNFF